MVCDMTAADPAACADLMAKESRSAVRPGHAALLGRCCSRHAPRLRSVGIGLLGSGHFSHDDTAFFPDNPVLGPVVDRIRCLHHVTRRAVGGAEGEADCTLFLVDGAIAAIASTRRLRAGWLEDCRCACGGLESIPDFIAPPG